MAILFVDGFDHYGTSQTSSMWDVVAGTTITSTNSRNNSGHALAIASTSESVSLNVAAGSNFIVGAAFMFSDIASPSATNTIFSLQDVDASATTQVALRVTATGQLRVVNGTGTVLATSAVNTLYANAYYFIEFKGTIGTSVSSNSCQVCVDGNLVLTVPAGSSTQNTANNTFNRVYVSTNGGSCLLDDFYLSDGVGGFLGDVRVFTLYADGEGDLSQWTNSSGNTLNNQNYVNDSPPDGDGSYVSASSVNLTELYTVSDVSAAANVFGVQQCSYARKELVGTRRFQPIQKIGGTVYTGDTNTLNGSYRYYKYVMSVDPSTSSAWTLSGFNAAQFGVKTVT